MTYPGEGGPPPYEPAPDDFVSRSAQAERHIPRQPIAPYPTYQPYPPLPPTRRGGPPWFVWAIAGCLGMFVLVVLGCAVISGTLAGIAIRHTPHAEQSATSTQTFTIGSARPSLVVGDGVGDVKIVAGASGAITVTATKVARDSSNDAARRDLDQIQVQATQSGDTIEIRTLFGADQATALGKDRRVDLVVEVPPTTNVRASLTTGALTMSGVGGLVQATVITGNVEFDGVQFADGSWVRVTTGRIDLRGALAPTASLDVEVTTGEARLTLPPATAAHLTADVTTGSIAVQGWPITPTRDNVTGARAQGDLGANPSGTLTVRVMMGSIELLKS